MGRSSIPPALIELSNPSTPEAQVDALRNLKNEIVGHEQRKELTVVHGVVQPLAGLLRAEARKGGKRRKGTTNGHGSSAQEAERAGEWSTEDELRFQATLVVGSLANGGPAFITPLLAGDVLPPLLEALSPAEAPAKLISTTLRTLNQIVDAVAQEKSWSDFSDSTSRSSMSYFIKERIYSKPTIDTLALILARPSRSPTVQQQQSWATKLIIKTCRDDSQRKLLLEVGVLDSLAAKLAGIAVADDPSMRKEWRSSNDDEVPATFIPEILEAVAVIIKDSHYNAARFLYSQPIQNLFAWPKDSPAAYEGYSSTSQSTSWDKLIPRLQTFQSKTDSYANKWPALGSYGPLGDTYTRLPSVDSLQQGSSRNVVTDESENPIFVWLMYVARRGEGKERLSACWLLALLKKFGERWPLNDPSKTTRERHFSYLIIPIVVKMIEEANPASDQAKKTKLLNPQAKEDNRFVVERAPLVLAELVAGNKALQNAAMDARVLPILVQYLKKSFDPVTTSSRPLWQPRHHASQPIRDPMIDVASSTLGKPGLSADVLHALKYRESALLAIAAISDTQDGLRKQVIDLGAAHHIIDSMKPYSEEETSTQNAGPAATKGGNPEPVLIAACKVTRSLSRSVSVLRTSLIDNDFAQPSFDLLMHPNVNVQIAATEVITNLVLEVSPMRTDIIEAGALKTLCEHCRSANFDLRYGSLWALKHLCLGIPSAMRIHCLEELGVGWLVQTLNGEPTKPSLATPLGMGTPNAAGEQVDILNAVDEPHMDVDESQPSSGEDEDTMTDSILSMRRQQRPGFRYTSATNIRERLQQIKNDEQDARLNSERDDVRIQEQALDFVRNFITADKASGEIIDHLLKTLGHTRFFEILDAKIRPKGSSSSSTTQPPPTTTSTTSTTPSYLNFATQRSSFHSTSTSPAAGTGPAAHTNWSTYPATELIISTLYILVHLANGRPQHRSLLISQSNLMSHVLPLLSHPRRDVRLPCAWFLNNLTWQEDKNDEAATKERALSLRALGFEEGAKVLGRDVDLDIRERAKTAVDQFGLLLGGAGASGGGNESSPHRRSGGGYGLSSGITGFGGSSGDGGSGGAGAGGSGSASGSGLIGGSRLGSLHQHRGWGHDSNR